MSRPSENICLVQLPSLPEGTRSELLKVTSKRTVCSDCLEVHHAVWTVGSWGSPGLVGDPGSQLASPFTRRTVLDAGPAPEPPLQPLLWSQHRAPFSRGAENTHSGALSPIFPGGTQDSPSPLLQESPCFSRITRFPESVQAKSRLLASASPRDPAASFSFPLDALLVLDRGAGRPPGGRLLRRGRPPALSAGISAFRLSLETCLVADAGSGAGDSVCSASRRNLCFSALNWTGRCVWRDSSDSSPVIFK